MIMLEQTSVEKHKNVIFDVLKELEKKKELKNIYFLLKRNENVDNEKDNYFSLNKLNFRYESLLGITREWKEWKKRNERKEKKEQKERKEFKECVGEIKQDYMREDTEKANSENNTEKEEEEEEEEEEDDDDDYDDDDDDDDDGDDDEQTKCDNDDDENEYKKNSGWEKKLEKQMKKEERGGETEKDCFTIIFNDKKIQNQKKKQELKENELLQKLTSSSINITDEAILEYIDILLNNEEMKKNCSPQLKINCFKDHYPFYDDLFSSSYYVKQEEGVECYFHLSKQLNNLTIVSLGKYNKILLEILHYIKRTNNDKNLKKMVKEYVKLEFDERLLKANVSGKRKKNTICINYNMVIFHISFDNKIYKIKSKVQGLLCDINEQLILNPSLLFADSQEGWLLILKNATTPKIETTHMQPVELYEKENKDFIIEFNSMLNFFQ